jgi:hypothetical protein
MDGHVIKPIETRMLFEALERVPSAQCEVVSVEAKSA